MSILVDNDTRVLVQGITGRDGSFHTEQMIDYGTCVVGGVTPGKGGQKVFNLPVFDSMAEGVAKTNANTSVIYVPARFARAAISEAAESGVKLIACITEGIPVNDMIQACRELKEKDITLIGPNCPGVISPGKSKVGIMPGHIHKPGHIGVISRSGTLTYEIVYALTSLGLGQSTCIGIGGDPIIGSGFIDLLKKFQEDSETHAVILVGEIGGDQEEKAAEYIKEHFTKPVYALIVGHAAPPGKTMGHAGAIIAGNTGTAQSKTDAFKAAGVSVARTLSELAQLVKEQ
ncbi:MAG: succinate--CoA ligase subunit alpha [Planctomycetes bacterium]|nr:succinate--CoA ligase subunit alpha [Planctomycetota bacterium]